MKNYNDPLMKNHNNPLMTIIILAMLLAGSILVHGQEYVNPALSPKDIADWVNSGGFIASGTGDPSVTAGIATGALYVDNTDVDYPKLWRYNGIAWAPLSGDSEALVNHLASDTDPHSANMKVSESMQVGNPELEPWAYIDSPAEGMVRFDHYISIIGSTSAPTPSAGAIYYNQTDNHFYGYNGSSWVQLDN